MMVERRWRIDDDGGEKVDRRRGKDGLKEVKEYREERKGRIMVKGKMRRREMRMEKNREKGMKVGEGTGVKGRKWEER